MNKKMAECHPDRPHHGKGLCKACNQRERRRTPEGRAKLKEQNNTPERKAYLAKYARTEKGRTSHNIASLKYNKSEEGKQVHKRAKDKWYYSGKGREYNRKYVMEQYTTDIQYKFRHNLRSRLRSALKNGQKRGSAINELGCTVPEAIAHIESLFQPGMTWDNHGEWHIDHIKPLSSFDLTDPEQFKQACHYSNLQPLWAIDNLKKSNKY